MTFGLRRVDVALAYAGIGGEAKPSAEYSETASHQVIGVNLDGVLHPAGWNPRITMPSRRARRSADLIGSDVDAGFLALLGGDWRGSTGQRVQPPS